MLTRYSYTNIIGSMLFCWLHPVCATTVNYSVENIVANTWEYTYTIKNDSLGFDINEFTVYFGFGDFDNLVISTSPATWDPLVVEPGNFLGNDGYYDALALSGGITPGDSMGGFSVRFDFLGAGTPGSQFFEIVEPTDFSILDSGQTNLIPVPAAVWLFGSGLIGMIGLARRKKS